MKQLVQRTWELLEIGFRIRWLVYMGSAHFPSKAERLDPDERAFIKKERLGTAAYDIKNLTSSCERLEKRKEQETQLNMRKAHITSRRLKDEQRHLARIQKLYEARWDLCHKMNLLDPAWGTRKEFIQNYAPNPHRVITSRVVA